MMGGCGQRPDSLQILRYGVGVLKGGRGLLVFGLLVSGLRLLDT